MYIGELARRTGASLKAIRLYESLGLLGRVQRQGTYRVYSDAHVMLVDLIRQAQGLDFRLAELKSVLKNSGGEPDWSQLLQQLALKRSRLQREVQRMEQLQVKLLAIENEIQMCLSGV